MGGNIKNQKRSDNRLDCPTDKPSHKPIWDWPRSGLLWVELEQDGQDFTGWSGFGFGVLWFVLEQDEQD